MNDRNELERLRRKYAGAGTTERDELQRLRQKYAPAAATGTAPAPEQPGIWDALWAGAKHSVGDLLTGWANFALTPNERQEVQQGGGFQNFVPEQEYAQIQQAHPIATAVGESTPYVAAGMGIGALLRGAGLLANLAGQGAAGAGIGGSMPADTAEERLQNAVTGGVGAVVGEGIGRAVGRAFAPQVIGATDNALIPRAEALDYRVLPSTRAGASPAPPAVPSFGGP